MRSRMSRGVYWFLGAVCVALLFAFWGAGYGIRVNDSFAVDYFPENEADGVLLHDTLMLGMEVKGVEAYCSLGQAITGRAGGRYFLAQPDKTVSTYDDREAWLTACQRLDQTFRGELVHPSRFRNPKLTAIYAVLSALLVLWLLVGYQRWRNRKGGQKPLSPTD